MKIFVAILNEGWVRVELASKLVRWTQEQKQHEIYLVFSNLRPIEHNRNTLVQEFLKSNNDYLLMIDSDNIPAKNPIELIHFQKDIISCPVWIYQQGHKHLNVYRQKENEDYLVPIENEKGLKEIDATGTGVILLSRKVLETIKKPFERKFDENGIEEIGQDIYFSMKAKEAGFRLFTHFDYISKHYKLVELSSL